MLLDFFRRRLFVIRPPVAGRPAEDEDICISVALERARAGAVLDFWRQGLDTSAIASRLNLPEISVCRIVQASRDRQRGRP
jgi:hypothetical protein